ncbi:hypothetical protein EV363DRAFT_1459601 [Boletus edulis]|nr:hypothetical protein EV363DRAFT_1459601 [Boletus edulis]
MSSQMPAGVDRWSRSPSIRSPNKRTSFGDSGTEQGRSPKKHTDLRSGVLGSPEYLHELMEDDSIDMANEEADSHAKTSAKGETSASNFLPRSLRPR